MVEQQKKDSHEQVVFGAEFKGLVTKAAFWKMAERCGAMGVSLLVQIVLARILAPADFGLIAIVVVFTNIAVMFVQSGLNTAIVQADNVSDLEYSTVFWASAALAVLLYAALFLCAPAIEAFFALGGLAAILRVLGLLLLIGAYNSIQVALLQKELRMRTQCVATVLSAILSGFAGIGVALFGFGVWALVVQMLLYQLISCLIMAYQVNWHPKMMFSLSRLKTLYSFGWKLLATSLLHTAYINLYEVIVGKVYSATALGYFSQGKKYPGYAESLLDGALRQVILAAAAKVKHSRSSVRSIMKRALQVSSSVVIPSMIFLCIAAEALVKIVFGDQWIPMVPFFQIFCVAFMLDPIAVVNQQCINAIGRSDISLKLEILKKSIAIVVTLCAALLNDLLVLALSSVVYSVIATYINLWPSKKYFGYSAKEQIKDIMQPLCISCVAALVAFAFRFLIGSEALLLVVQIIAFSGTYVALSEGFKSPPFLYTKKVLFSLLSRRGSEK